MSALRVLKFGGSSVGHAESIRLICNILNNCQTKTRFHPVLVLSAMYGVTDKLTEAYKCLNNGQTKTVGYLRNEIYDVHLKHHNLLIQNHPKHKAYLRYFDYILNYNLDRYFRYPTVPEGEFVTLGERLSINLLNNYFRSLWIPTAPFNADRFIVLDKNGNVDWIRTCEYSQAILMPFIKQGGIPLITGYMCQDSEGKSTNLGRGGSDYSSAIIANVLHAKELEFWKLEAERGDNGFMVGYKPRSEQEKWLGIISANPDMIDTATTVDSISYDEATELSLFGKKVLHRETMEPLVQAKINVRVRNTLCDYNSGSVIKSTSGKGVKLIANSGSSNFYKLNKKRIVDNHIYGKYDKYNKVVGLVGNYQDGELSKVKGKMERLINSYGIKAVIPETLTGSDNNLTMMVNSEFEKPLSRIIHDQFIDVKDER